MKEENQVVRKESFQSLILIVLIVAGVGIFVWLQIKDIDEN
jgi:hypothetical protein